MFFPDGIFGFISVLCRNPGIRLLSFDIGLMPLACFVQGILNRLLVLRWLPLQGHHSVLRLFPSVQSVYEQAGPSVPHHQLNMFVRIYALG